MKTFNEYLTEMNRPTSGMPTVSRDLEGFRPILDSLKLQTKSVMDPEIKQNIYALVNPFYNEMSKILMNYKSQGKGYSPRYQYQGNMGQIGQPNS